MEEREKKHTWIGVDLDGTLAITNPGEPHRPGRIGEPIPKMIAKVKAALETGIEVRILTARVSSIEPDPDFERVAVELWCEEHLGQKLRVTAEKDYHMKEIWDDRAKQVVKNTGDFLEETIEY